MERTIAKRPVKLFERLLDSDVKADLLTFFHNNANLSETPEALARKVGRNLVEVQRELEDLVELGILKRLRFTRLEWTEIRKYKMRFQSNLR